MIALKIIKKLYLMNGQAFIVPVIVLAFSHKLPILEEIVTKNKERSQVAEHYTVLVPRI